MEAKGINPAAIYITLGVAAIIIILTIFFTVRSDTKEIFSLPGSQAEKDKKKLIDKMKIDYSKTSVKEAGAMKIANIIDNKLRGVTDDKADIYVYTIFKKLKVPKYDVPAIFKAFGVRDGQTLTEWVQNETMIDKYKDYILEQLSRVKYNV